MEQLIQAIAQAVREAGLDCVRANPGGRAPRLTKPAVCISVKQAASSAAGFYDYLGVIDDPETGACELYGRRVAYTLQLEAVVPASSGAESAEQTAETLLETLTLGDCGARVSACSIGQSRYDAAADVFRCAVTAEASAYYYAQTGADQTTLTDFILKGDWK